LPHADVCIVYPGQSLTLLLEFATRKVLQKISMQIATSASVERSRDMDSFILQSSWDVNVKAHILYWEGDGYKTR